LYGKIFESMYDGTLSADWQAMIVFQQLIVLADSEGIVDITPPALSRRTGIPLDVIEYGINKLEQPDPYSRSPESEGKRIVLIDEHRNWGWIIVNYEHYRDLASREDRREQNRINKQKQRDREKSADVSISQRSSAMSAHEDVDEDVDEDITTTGDLQACPYQKIVDLWHQVLHDLPKIKKLTPSRKQQLKARWKEYPKISDWQTLFEEIRESQFLMGLARPIPPRTQPFVLDFDFLIKEGNFVKIIEGKYHR